MDKRFIERGSGGRWEEPLDCIADMILIEGEREGRRTK